MPEYWKIAVKWQKITAEIIFFHHPRQTLCKRNTMTLCFSNAGLQCWLSIGPTKANTLCLLKLSSLSNWSVWLLGKVVLHVEMKAQPTCSLLSHKADTRPFLFAGPVDNRRPSECWHVSRIARVPPRPLLFLWSSQLVVSLVHYYPPTIRCVELPLGDSAIQRTLDRNSRPTIIITKFVQLFRKRYVSLFQLIHFHSVIHLSATNLVKESIRLPYQSIMHTPGNKCNTIFIFTLNNIDLSVLFLLFHFKIIKFVNVDSIVVRRLALWNTMLNLRQISILLKK